MKRFNVNELVKVKLTDVGKDIFYHRWDSLNEMCKEVVIEPRYPKVDEEGFTEFQLWDLMNIYGPHLRMGCNVPFEENLIYFEDASEEDIECIKSDRDDYKRRFNEFCSLTHRLKDALLGPNWYVTDSCGEPQCSEIIIDEIIAKYGKAEKPKKKWLFWGKYD